VAAGDWFKISLVPPHGRRVGGLSVMAIKVCHWRAALSKVG
jgi:hypothetical protein